MSTMSKIHAMSTMSAMFKMSAILDIMDMYYLVTTIPFTLSKMGHRGHALFGNTQQEWLINL